MPLKSTVKKLTQIFSFHFNQYKDGIRLLTLKMAPEGGRNVCTKLLTMTLAVIFMIKILASSQLYRLPKFIGSRYGSLPKKQLRKLEELQKKDITLQFGSWKNVAFTIFNLNFLNSDYTNLT